MTQKITLPHNWTPRPYQIPLWNYFRKGGAQGKRVVAVWHRRAGKDEIAMHLTATALAERPAMYWHMLPEAAQARKAIWDAVNPHTGKRRIDEAFPHALRASTRDQEMCIKFINGSVWQVLGSDNYDSLVGSPPAGVVFSEWPLSHPDAWAYLRPILAENNGWAFFIYTPRGDSNHGYNSYQYALKSDNEWFGQLLTVDDTGIFDEKTLKEEYDEYINQYGKSRGEALFNQEYYCSFHEAFTGKSVYPEFSYKYHVSHDPLLPYAQAGALKQGIVRGWDNTGLSPACTVTYINSTGQWYIVKEFIGQDIGMAEFAEEVQLWCSQAFPTETKFKDIGDPAGTNRDTRKGSPKQYIYEATGIMIQDGVQNFNSRREAVAARLRKHYDGEPALVICAEGCPTLIKGFEGGYCYPEIGNTGYFKPTPEKNIYSHVHDSCQYIASILFPAGPKKQDSPRRKQHVPQQGRNAVTGY